MPRVAEDHHESRREEILDAAREVAMEKPLGRVTMKDIIRQCGASQGAIYHYFSGLDEIWLSMIDRFYKENDVTATLQKLFEREASPVRVVQETVRAICQDLAVTVPGYGKLIMELNTMVLANPALYERMEARGKGYSQLDRLSGLFAGWYDQQMEAGTLRPRVGREQLLMMVGSTYLGLRYHATMLHLQPGEGPVALDEYLGMQEKSWTLAMLYLLGIEEERA